MESAGLPGKRFTRKIEDFTCEVCGTAVHGTGYTDHCPKCLSSKHVDVMPGDRKNKCGGIMKPVSVEYRNGSYVIYYVCGKCREKKRMSASSSDNKDSLERFIGGG